MDRRRRFLVGKRTDARTFAQVTDYRARVTEAAPAANDNKGFSFVFTPTSDCINRLKACAFGMVKDNIPIDEIARRFTMISNSQIRIKRLGGVYVLVDFGSKDAMDACVSHKDAWFSEVFDMFREWKQGDCATHRECILNVHGVPPQAWNEDFFRLIAVRFGSFVKLHNSFDRSDYLEMAKVSIITTCRQPISRTFKVLINGLEYEVSVVEVQQPPMEEASWCIGGGSSSANGSEKVEESRRRSDTDESNSPDPFGIRDAIKNLAKGKSALVIEPASEASHKGGRHGECSKTIRKETNHRITSQARMQKDDSVLLKAGTEMEKQKHASTHGVSPQVCACVDPKQVGPSYSCKAISTRSGSEDGLSPVANKALREQPSSDGSVASKDGSTNGLETCGSASSRYGPLKDLRMGHEANKVEVKDLMMPEWATGVNGVDNSENPFKDNAMSSPNNVLCEDLSLLNYQKSRAKTKVRTKSKPNRKSTVKESPDPVA
ncbi:hypothetical protein Tsubulata_044185 [Turnera subulata]|uniref:DUF4283 domain-containing protein n=1 Tax=Turnera subulata TaxID=218843 RepID=A0A9Q0JFI1_9ROSI|nr:hypothetical protein Tsubulata_044185 [Turnera subulata]